MAARFYLYQMAQLLAQLLPVLFDEKIGNRSSFHFALAFSQSLPAHAQHATSVPVSERNQTRARLTALTCVQPRTIRLLNDGSRMCLRCSNVGIAMS